MRRSAVSEVRKLRNVEKLVLPLANLTEPLIRLFIMASQHCVVAFDTLALSGASLDCLDFNAKLKHSAGIPPRAIEILEDHNIPKSGFNIIGTLPIVIF